MGRPILPVTSRIQVCSPTERAVIDELIKMIGLSFYVTIESNQIEGLRVNHAMDLSDLDGVIAKLPNLKSLSFNRGNLGASELPSLQTLNHLESICFSQGTISDAGLKSLAPLTNLFALSFYCCSGITDEGLRPLGQLKNLKLLQLYREDDEDRDRPDAGWRVPPLRQARHRDRPDEPDAPGITDAGLIHLAGLTKLEILDVYGQSLTDAGLEHLKGLPEIKDLTISGDGITDAGLQHLKALKKLVRLSLNATQVTPLGRKELKAALPMLQDYW